VGFDAHSHRLRITDVTFPISSSLNEDHAQAFLFNVAIAGGAFMRLKLASAVLCLASLAQAKEHKQYQSGQLMQMDSVECGYDEKDGKSFAGEMLGTDSGNKKTHALLCQEYLLQAERVIYRIRPKDDKHPVLLPVGEKAQFRMDKDKMILRVEDLDGKDRDYFVVSMTPRQDGKSFDPGARLNHLQ
jgi:hypothetical protein